MRRLLAGSLILIIPFMGLAQKSAMVFKDKNAPSRKRRFLPDQQ